MPMSRQYKCYKCGKEFEILWPSSKEALNTATCECGNKAKREYGCQLIIDEWSPTGNHSNQAQRDIEHFEKMKNRGKTTMYHEDRAKQDIPVNLKEV